MSNDFLRLCGDKTFKNSLNIAEQRKNVLTQKASFYHCVNNYRMITPFGIVLDVLHITYEVY